MSERDMESAAWSLAAEYFTKDPNMIYVWFATRNPVLNDLRPQLLLDHGHGERLLRYMVNALEVRP